MGEKHITEKNTGEVVEEKGREGEREVKRCAGSGPHGFQGHIILWAGCPVLDREAQKPAQRSRQNSQILQ